MSTASTLESIFAEAQSLAPEDRFMLAERLWRGESYEDEIGSEAYSEIMRRVGEVNSGSAKTIPGATVWREVDDMLATLR